MEPYRLRLCRINSSPNPVHFFTCARPGRSTYNYKKKDNRVFDVTVSQWVCGLPGPNTAIVSLLGRKPKQGNQSEFSFYSFCGGWDTPSERRNKPTLQEWLRERHEELHILVREFPTNDLCNIPTEELGAMADEIRELISRDHTVVVVDSGGVVRIGQVRKLMNATVVSHESKACRV